jgi:hypothetical protein
MVSSRPSASILPGASVSGAWWGTSEPKIIAKEADGARRRGDLQTAKAVYRLGYEEAVRRHGERTPHLEHTEMEAEVGLGLKPKNSEIFRGQTSLIHFQHGLHKAEVLLSFHALMTERKGGKVIYLVSEHSVQTIPGAMLLSTGPEAGTGWFPEVGDSIHNAADPQWGERKKRVYFKDRVEGRRYTGGSR